MSCASPQPPGAALAPGFRFHPTDEELVGYYLKRKVSGRALRVDAIAEVDLYKAEPWDLPGKSRIRSRDAQWYFFCVLDKKYASRSRINRATGSGYWKTTGKDRAVWRGGRAIGMKKTLVFHAGRAPRGERTNWVMHEYRLEDEELARAGIPQDAFVVCRIFQKRGPGPQNGAQYGAPFVEEEWEDDGLPVVDDKGGEGGLIIVDNPVLVAMDDDEENKDRGVQGKNAAGLVEPDGQCEMNNSVDPDSLVNMCQEWGLSDALDGSTGVPGLRSDQNVEVMGGYSDAENPNRNLVAVNDGYLELNDFAYSMGSNCPVSVACSEERPGDEHFVNGEITCSQDLNDMKEYFSTMEENYLSEQFLVSETGEYNYYVELDDLLGPKPDDCSSGEPADDGLVKFDAPNWCPHADHGLSSGINGFIDSTMANSNGPDLMDELIAYFGATENMQHYDLKFESGTSTSNQSNPAPMVNGENVEAYHSSPQPSKAISDCSASCSLTPDVGKQSSSKSVDVQCEPDAQFDSTWDKALSRRLANLLDAISPPPAFAAEYPIKVPQSVGHHSATLSSSLTAGMVQIHGVTMSGNGKNWFMQKNANAVFVVSHGMARNDVTGSLASFERMSKMQSGITVFILRNSFHLLFLSVLFLAASFKIGVMYAQGKLLFSLLGPPGASSSKIMGLLALNMTAV